VWSLRTAKGQLNILRDYFGSCRLRSITQGDVRQFHASRLAQATRTKTQRTIASVNRELSMLRHMLNVAQREGWILRNPFAAGDSLISLADENKRERILTREEEVKLLAACETPQRAHLKAILICALDTGMRQGEIFSLRWRDVDLENGLLNTQAFHTKTMKERQVAITTGLAIEMERLKASAPDNRDGLVFGILDNVKRSFIVARSKAGLKDLRFHDLRHTQQQRGSWARTFRYRKLAVYWATVKRIQHIATSTRMSKPRNAPRRLWTPLMPKPGRPSLCRNWCAEGEPVLNFDSE
jgi:integrase